MSEYQSPLGTLSSGGQLLGDPGSGPTPPPRKTPWAAIIVIAVVVLFALAVVAGAAALIVLSDGDSSDDPPVASTGPAGTEDHSEERDVPPAEPEAPAAPQEEEPSSPRERPSLLSAAGTAEALSAIRAAAKSDDAITLRVDAAAVTAIVKGNVFVYRDGKLQKLPGPPSAPLLFDLGDVDAAAPSRINAAVKEKGDRVEYVVYFANPVTDRRSWTVVTKGGKNYSAGASGRRLCKLGEEC
jgi:hypothetical protein